MGRRRPLSASDLIAVLMEHGAEASLVELAQSRFEEATVLVEVCGALHRELDCEGFDYAARLGGNGLERDDLIVLEWFLARNRSCASPRSGGDRHDHRGPLPPTASLFLLAVSPVVVSPPPVLRPLRIPCMSTQVWRRYSACVARAVWLRVLGRTHERAHQFVAQPYWEWYVGYRRIGDGR